MDQKVRLDYRVGKKCFVYFKNAFEVNCLRLKDLTKTFYMQKFSFLLLGN